MTTARACPREAEASDIPALVALVESAYRGDSSRAGWTTEADLLGGQRIDPYLAAEMIADPHTTVLVRDDPHADGDRLACAQVVDRGDGLAYFGTFAVAPACQGSGTGSAMLAAAEGLARTVYGARTMRMTVIRQRTDLLAYYARRGYGDTGAREPFPYGDERFGRPKVDDLEFAVLEKPLA